MKARRLHIGLPLLAKELTEQAARRRTYITRTVYASLLFFIAGLQFMTLFASISNDPLQLLGQGRWVFSFLVGLQFTGIFLFMPPLICGVVTAEKERNSLGLLLLTKLGPWTILFEKLTGRLVPMFTFLLLSLPVLAFAYAMGGVSLPSLVLAVWFLTLTVLQVATLGLACSAFFRTTPSALIACYLMGIAMYAGPPLLQEFELVRFDFVLDSLLSAIGLPDVIVGRSPELSWLLFGPFVFFGLGSTLAVGQTLAASSPILISIAVWLGLARLFLVRRAFADSGNPLVGVFKMVDRFFAAVNNNRLTRGIVLMQDQTALPAEEPVAWRETTKKSLGTTRYLFRVLVALELPLIVFCVLTITVSGLLALVSAIMLLLWIAVVLVITVASANLIAGERARQTFDVLLSTPITGRELVEQKFRGVRRLMFVLSVPFVTLFVFQILWRSVYSGFNDWDDLALYLVCSMLTVIVYLPLVGWMSFFIALKVHSQTKAIVASLAVVLIWILFPFIIVFPIFIISQVFSGFSGNSPPEELLFTLFLISPVWLVPVNEFHTWNDLDVLPALQLILHFSFQYVLLFTLRRQCLESADRLLGRE